MALLAMLAGVAHAGRIEDDLARIPEAGTPSWDDAVKFRLLVEYDEDGSHWLEGGEVREIPCAIWNQLDVAIAEQGQFRGLLRTYGFRHDLLWMGHLLGVKKAARGRAEVAMRACGLTEDGPLGADFVKHPDHEQAAALLSQPDSADASALLRQRIVLVGTYDLDDSDALDTPDEVAGIPCPIWGLLDERARWMGAEGAVTAYGLTRDGHWMGMILGFDPSVEDDTVAAATRCGLPGADLPVSTVDAATLVQRLVAVSEPGTTAWDKGVQAVLIDAYDLDRSGAIDRPEEVGAMSCLVWTTLDVRLRSAGHPEGVVATYGLGAGDAWAGDSLGLAKAIRPAVQSALDRCSPGLDGAE
jgi:hypothetical protein